MSVSPTTIVTAAGCSLLMGITIAIILIIWRRKRLKKASYDVKSETILIKDLKPPTKIPAIRIQLDHKPKPELKDPEERRVSYDDFEGLQEVRRGVVDPLLGVFHPGSPMKKFYSVESLIESNSALPKLDVSLVWTPLDQSVNISLFAFENIPKKFSSSLWIFVSILIPSRTTDNSLTLSKNIQLGKDSTVPFRFNTLNFEELEGSRVSIELKGKKKGFFKETSIGESTFYFNDLHIIPNKVSCLSLNLNPSKQSSNVISSDFGTAGQLLIGLKCKWNCKEILHIFINIKKAIIAKPFVLGREFKVEVTLRERDEILSSFATKCASGLSPEWDYNFTCELHQDQLEESVIDLTLLRLAPVQGVSKIGVASLSLSTDRNGCSHWQEALRCMGTKVQQWHSVLLLRSFVGYIGNERKDLVGKLLIGMQFIDTRQSCKMKIVIKKLTDFEFHKGGGEYKIKVVVYQMKDKFKTFTTKGVSINDLLWNEPFVFHLDPLSLRHYKIELDLIRTGRLKRTSKIGSVTLGTAENPSGEDHWDECLLNSLMEIEKWHPLLPST